MRASRLVSILMLLQGRGKLTAQQLADELAVSIRTVYRDLDALAASGVSFERAVSGCPWCSPFRASLLTGRYPQHAVSRTPQRLDLSHAAALFWLPFARATTRASLDEALSRAFRAGEPMLIEAVILPGDARRRTERLWCAASEHHNRMENGS